MCKQREVSVPGRAALCGSPPADCLVRTGTNSGNAAVPEGRGRRLPAGGHENTSAPGRSMGQPSLGTGLSAPGLGLLSWAQGGPAWAPQSHRNAPPDRGGAEGASAPLSPSRPDSFLQREECGARGQQSFQQALAAGSVRGSRRRRMCSAEPGWVCPLVEHRGVVSVEGAGWLHRDSPGVLPSTWP